nr:hypothetical protein Itr_chr10CG18690 [Ipomoea trifida]
MYTFIGIILLNILEDSLLFYKIICFGRNRWAKAEGEVVLLRSRGSAASVRRSSIEGSKGKSEGRWQRAKTEASAVLLRSVGRRIAGSRGKSEGGWQRAKTEASAVLLRSVGRRLREAEGTRKADGRGRRRRGGGSLPLWLGNLNVHPNN